MRPVTSQGYVFSFQQILFAQCTKGIRQQAEPISVFSWVPSDLQYIHRLIYMMDTYFNNYHMLFGYKTEVQLEGY